MNELIPFSLPLTRRALPAPGLVELWISDLADFPLAGDQPPAGRQERRRALRLRQRFLVRLLLGSYLNRPGKDIRFEYGKAGKPALVAELAASELQFNLSHSGSWLALAVSRTTPVGVDIECRRELPRASALARRFLSAAEAQTIADLPEPERSERFLVLWSRREALVKAMGVSVIASLESIELDPACGQPRVLPPAWPDILAWTLLGPALPPPLIGALALPDAGQRVETRVLDCGSMARSPGPAIG